MADLKLGDFDVMSEDIMKKFDNQD